MKISILMLSSVLSLSSFAAMSDWLAAVGGLASFTRKVEITVASEKGAGLTDFPALVRLSPSIFGFTYDDFKADGLDLVFTDVDGNPVPHEIDTWNHEGESLVWVKLPSAAVGSKVIAYYGSDSVASAPSAADFKNAVWSDFAGVFHMGEVFAAADDASAKTAYDSSPYGFHATAKAGSGQSARLGEMAPNANGAIGVARVNQTTASKPGAYLSIPNCDSAGLGSVFTYSAWYYASSCSGYPRPASRKNAYGDNEGWEIQVENGSKVNFAVRGAGSTKASATCKSEMTSGWHHYAWVFNGAKVNIYQDGVLIGNADQTIGEVTDNGKPISVGNNANGTEQSWCGSYDEVRLCKSALSASAVAAEYETVHDAGFLSYGVVGYTDQTAIGFDGAPMMSVDGDGHWVFSVKVIGGEGAIAAVFTDLASLTETTNDVASAVTVGETYSVSADSLAEGRFYSVRFIGESTGGSLVKSFDLFFYNGEVSVVKVADADEAGLVAGSFAVSIPAAIDVDLVYDYEVGGTAVPGKTYKRLSGSVTIPAGETSATIEVCPVLSFEMAEDVTVSVTLDPATSLPGELTAELTVKNDPNAMAGDHVRVVATTGSDETGEGTEGSPFRTIARAIADLTPDGGTVCVKPGKYEEVSDSTQYAALLITNAISVIGLGTRPEDVTVTSKKTGSTCHVFELNHPEATLRNLWIKDGKQWSNNWGNSDRGINLKIGFAGGVVEDCVLSGFSQGNYDQQGQCCWMGGPGRISRCRIINNKNGSDWDNVLGTAVFASAGLIEDCLIASNSCYNASAVNLSGTAVMVNCTIADNTGVNYCGVRAKDATVKAVNCAIFNNAASASKDGSGGVYRGNGACFIGCASALAIPDSVNCVVGQPGFAGPSNYRLTPASVCFEAGVSRESYGATGAVDLLGQKRVIGSAVDIGCCENQQDAFACGFSWSVDRVIAPGQLTVTASSLSAPAGESTVFGWELTNLDADAKLTFESSEDANRVLADIPAGRYTLKLTATAGGETAEHVESDILQVGPADVYVNAGNGGATFPYDTPETAAADVATAIETAVDGSRIHIAPNEYPITATLQVKKAVSIVGEGLRPSNTVIRRASGDIRVMLINHPNAFVANLTLQDGHAKANGSCLYIDIFGGAVSNCVIRGGYSWDDDGRSGGGAYLCAGTLTHCEFTGCSVKPKTDGKQVVQVLGAKGGLISNCLIRDNDANGGAYTGPVVGLTGSAVMENCTIAGCKVALGSASVSSGVGTAFRNCAIFVENADGEAANCTGADEDNKFWPTRFFNCVTSGDISEYTTEHKGKGWYYAVDSVTNAVAGECFIASEAGNFRVRRGGPLDNRGQNAVQAPMSLDFAGNARIYKDVIDVGCYEGVVQRFVIMVR